MKTLKNSMLALVAALSVAGSFVIVTHAEDAAPATTTTDKPADKPKCDHPHRHHHGAFGHWKKLGEELNLTDDQKEKIKEIIKAKMKETKDEINDVLTPEQRAKLEAKKAEWKAKHADGKGFHRGPKSEDKPAS